MTKITYLIPKPSSEGGMTAITKMLYEINYFDNIQFFHFNTSYNSGGKLGRFREFTFRFVKFVTHLIRVRPDAIFVMSNSYLGFYEKTLYCLIARFLGVKSMLNHVGGEFDKFYRKNFFNKWLISIVIRFPNALLIGSSYWCNYFQTLFPGVKVFSVPNPIIANLYKENSVLRDNQEKFVIISLFRLIKEKGVCELLSVIKSICSMFQHVEFVIIGGGPMLEAIKTDLSQYIQSGSVRVLGFVDDSTKIREILRSDVYLMLTHFDLMPISIMEAMAASKPILSTRVGGIPDMVEEEVNGFLFEVGQTAEVVAKLKFLINNPNTVREMGLNSRKKIDDCFDISRITALHQQVAVAIQG